MFVIPIGHEKLELRRLPWVTIGIAVICCLVQIDACLIESKIQEPINQVMHDAAELVGEVASTCRLARTCEDYDAVEILEGIRAGKLGDAVARERMALIDTRMEALRGRSLVHALGYRPASSPPWQILTSLFTHGDLMHLLGNMLFLYVVGLTIEERWGRLRFLVFYLLGGVVAALAYGLVHRGSEMPLVGASGAIAAMMGAFAILYSGTRIRFFYWIWIRVGTFGARAWLVLPLWFIEQLFAARDEVSNHDEVAYSAHVGGFAFGAIVAAAIRLSGYDRRFVIDSDRAAGEKVDHRILDDARALLKEGNSKEALERVDEVLKDEPGHLEATELALDIARHTRDHTAYARHAATLAPAWVKKKPAGVIAIFARLAKVDGEHAPDERLLGYTLAAAETLSDRATAQDVLRRLYRSHPGTPHIARAVWVLSELAAKDGDREMAVKLWQKLVDDHPGDRWSDKARERLSET